MHPIHRTSARARGAALTAALCILPLLAACGDRGEQGSAASADTAAARADLSPMGVAKETLGPDVRIALPFRIPNRGAQFIAAALPVAEWVPDPARSGNNAAPGGHEVVILEVTPESHAVHKPGLYVSREPWLPRMDDTAAAPPADSATLARTMGVDDADGDGTPEVWAAQYRAEAGGGHTWEVRAYDRNGRTMYQVTATYGGGAGGEVTQQAFSASVQENPAVRQWLADRVMRLEAARPGAAPGEVGR